MTTYDSYKGVPLDKLAEDVKWWEYCNGGCSMSLSNRLWEIHEETRWVSVSERMPTREDGGLNNKVLVLEVENESPRNKYIELVDWFEVGSPNYFYTVTHWKRIDKPEGV
jgi:hypothetical protein